MIKKKKNVIVKKKKIILKGRSEERVPTGIINFDKLINGGFEQYSTNLIVGGSGVGKSIFGTQFLVGGMKRGEKCLYVTFEEKKTRFYENMLDFGINLEEYEKKGLFYFLEYTPNKVKTMLEEGGGLIENIIFEKKISRVVIDSITSFALLFESETEKREAALSLFNLISGWNCTSVLTFEEESLNTETKTSKALEFESDSIILLYYLFSNKRNRERYLEILKMRGSNHSSSVYGFDITKKGIVVKNKPVKKIPKEIK